MEVRCGETSWSPWRCTDSPRVWGSISNREASVHLQSAPGRKWSCEMKLLLQWSIFLTYSAFQPGVFQTSVFESLQGSQSKNKMAHKIADCLLNRTNSILQWFFLLPFSHCWDTSKYRKGFSSHFQSFREDDPEFLQIVSNFKPFYEILDSTEPSDTKFLES